MQRSKPKNEIVFWVLMDRNDSNIYTTLSELKDNYRYLTFFPEVVMKGIFSELYAAEGSNFTNKILLDPNTGEHVLHNENYTYDIIDEKVRTVYTLLKEWQQSHSTMYDMLVDPLNIDTPSGYRKNSFLYSCRLKLYPCIIRSSAFKATRLMSEFIALAIC